MRAFQFRAGIVLGGPDRVYRFVRRSRGVLSSRVSDFGLLLFTVAGDSYVRQRAKLRVRNVVLCVRARPFVRRPGSFDVSACRPPFTRRLRTVVLRRQRLYPIRSSRVPGGVGESA